MKFQFFLALMVCLAAIPTAAQSPDPIADVQALYNSAAYEDALVKLDALRGAPVARVEQYRAFCLLALGRRDEATVSVGKAVDADPLWTPRDGDASPRVQSFYAEERRKLLPDIARGVYTDARADYVAKNYAAAIAGFTRVQELIAAVGSNAADVSDLGLLAGDFLNLSRAALAPAAAPTAPAAREESAPKPQPLAQPADPETPVRGPVAVKQSLPPWNRTTWAGNLNGVLRIEIDESGAVTKATIIRASEPRYDLQVLEAARSWRYEPALRNGRAIPSTKDISFVLKP